VPHAVRVHSVGGPEVLRFESVAPAEPGPGQVRVRVRAAGVNFIDVYFRTGLYPRPLPFVAGMEGAGVVDAAGPGAALRPGQRVAWASVPGSYAEEVLAPEALLVRVPDAVDDSTAAAAMLQGMTAHYLAHATRATRPGDTALVHAAAGGVGLLLVQMLVEAGARVIATCGSAEKEKLAREAGAGHVIRYDRGDFADEAREASGGRGCDVVYDSVGRDTFEGSLRALRPRGLLVLYGQSSGPVPPFDLARLGALGSLFVTRPSLAHYTADRAELELRAGAVLDAVAAGRLRLRIGARFALRDAAEAHRALEGRQTTGKVLLSP
jgi:NADPH2:quinone reductase